MHWSWTESVLAYEPVHVMLTSNFQHEAFVFLSNFENLVPATFSLPHQNQNQHLSLPPPSLKQAKSWAAPSPSSCAPPG